MAAPVGYEPSDPPSTTDPQVLAHWMADQLRQIAALTQTLGYGTDKMYYTPPPKVWEGLIMLADGTKWNPGSGKGFYGYHSGSWHFLG